MTDYSIPKDKLCRIRTHGPQEVLEKQHIILRKPISEMVELSAIIFPHASSIPVEYALQGLQWIVVKIS